MTTDHKLPACVPESMRSGLALKMLLGHGFGGGIGTGNGFLISATVHHDWFRLPYTGGTRIDDYRPALNEVIAKKYVREHFPHLVVCSKPVDSEEVYYWSVECGISKYGRVYDVFGFEDPDDAFHFKFRFG